MDKFKKILEKISNFFYNKSKKYNDYELNILYIQME